MRIPAFIFVLGLLVFASHLIRAQALSEAMVFQAFDATVISMTAEWPEADDAIIIPEVGCENFSMTAIFAWGNDSITGDTVRIAAPEPLPLPPHNASKRWRWCNLRITWAPSPSENVVGYFIRKYYPETGQVIDLAQLGADKLRFTDRHVRRNERVIYRIHARDAYWRLGDAFEIELGQ